MHTIDVARQFSRLLGGRYVADGPFSGEAFREELLKPAFQRAVAAGSSVTVNFDDVAGIPTSFLEEAFGGLVRSLPAISDHVFVDRIAVVANRTPQLWPFTQLAVQFMKEAAKQRRR
jgi:hypothetical protein